MVNLLPGGEAAQRRTCRDDFLAPARKLHGGDRWRHRLLRPLQRAPDLPERMTAQTKAALTAKRRSAANANKSLPLRPSRFGAAGSASPSLNRS